MYVSVYAIRFVSIFLGILITNPNFVSREDGLEDPWLMSFSNTGSNVTVVFSRDTLTTAVVKNVITVVLFIFISYVNSSLVHIFTKHQVGKNFNKIPQEKKICAKHFHLTS